MENHDSSVSSGKLKQTDIYQFANTLIHQMESGIKLPAVSDNNANRISLEVAADSFHSKLGKKETLNFIIRTKD